MLVETKRVQYSLTKGTESLYSSLPFGDSLTSTGGDATDRHFTGTERHRTGLDYFGARYYASSMGRWMSPDWADKPEAVPYSDLMNPQSLNLYGYVGNNPLSRADKDGHCCDPRDALAFAAGFANAFGSDNLAGAGRMDQTTSAGRLGASFGDFAAAAGGAVETAVGTGGEIGGLALDATGAGALVGVPAGVVSAGVIAHGTTTASTGFSNLLMEAKRGESGGPGAGKTISDKTKGLALDENKAANGGQAKCVFCKEPVGEGTNNKINFDHADAKSKGGNNSLNNVNVTCEFCNKSKGTGDVPKNTKPAN